MLSLKPMYNPNLLKRKPKPLATVIATIALAGCGGVTGHNSTERVTPEDLGPGRVLSSGIMTRPGELPRNVRGEPVIEPSLSTELNEKMASIAKRVGVDVNDKPLSPFVVGEANYVNGGGGGSVLLSAQAEGGLLPNRDPRK